MRTRDLRKAFIEFFKKRGHSHISSSSVVPHDDPTILFTNAGMNQFKKVFLGETKLDYTRAVTAQKCIRVGGKHNDLDNVGHTSRHMTFFEMLGNFSFGDYFKEEAIAFAWDFTVNHLQLPEERIWISVFEDDDEAYELWKKWVPEKKIARLTAKDNFWAMGDTGPCGPCSELYFDKGEKYGKADNLKADTEGERFFEFWNLVFMQYNKDEAGHMHRLPRPSIDTGMGLERAISLKTGVSTIFETDILRHLITQVENLSGVAYEKNKPAFHVIADHMRTLAFSIADGAVPSNVDRGYVLRKVLRRAIRYGRQIQLDKPFFAKLFPTLLELMGSDYPELKSAEHKICEILTLEEENFFKTLHRGGGILQSIIDVAHQSKAKQITGNDAFKLKDTYGFPLEEILLLAKDSGLEVNLDAYMLLEEKARELSKGAREKKVQVAKESLFAEFVEKSGKVDFIGYDALEASGAITGILVEGEFKENLSEGEAAGIILDQTPFYAEMGGQVGDVGTIFHHGAEFEVTDCTSPYPGVILHKGVLRKGKLIQGEPVTARVEGKRRRLISRNHSATHLLHAAIEAVLGPHIRQMGSLVEADRIRFDFSHHKPLTDSEIHSIEKRVNDEIRGHSSVVTSEISYDEAQKQKDIKQFFGEKYGAKVRVVRIGKVSSELCGGIHVKEVGEIGLFRIVKESSIAAGVRRIEAVTGQFAEEFMYSREAILKEAAEILDTSPVKVPSGIKSLMEEQGRLKEGIKKYRKVYLRSIQDELLEKKEMVGDIPILFAKVDLQKEELGEIANDLLVRMGSGVLLLGLAGAESCQLLMRVTPDLVKKGILANEQIAKIAPLVGGSGGGKGDNAQAGGKKPENLDEALRRAKDHIRQLASV